MDLLGLIADSRERPAPTLLHYQDTECLSSPLSVAGIFERFGDNGLMIDVYGKLQ